MSLSKVSTFGEVFTKPEVVSFMLDQIDYKSTKDLSRIKLLEPSAGDGEFIVAVINRLRESSNIYEFSFKQALKNIHAVEIDNSNCESLKSRLILECNLTNEELEYIKIINEDFLFVDFKSSYDFIVGNPPYVRWDNLEKEYKKRLKENFSCISGRSDLFIAFYEKCLSLLHDNGILNFICSNRWFKSAYGKSLRRLVKKFYSLSSVIDIEKASPFRSDVLGYPAITTIEKKIQVPLINFYATDCIQDLNNGVEYSKIDSSVLNSDIWSMNNYFNQLYKTKYYRKIEENQYKIRIGIATGKDSVFIRNLGSCDLEEDRMVPIIMASDLNNESSPKSYVLNCFDEKKRVVNLDNYPLMKGYLSEYEITLKNRHIAKKNPNHWFRTIDKIRYDDINALKILLPDISGTNSIKIGGKGYYPHHNLYYITSELGDFHLKVLAGVLSSKFIKDQLELISNKMNGGYPRWQSQNLKRLIIPDILSMNDKWKSNIVLAYLNGNQDQIDYLLKEEVVEENYFEKNSMLLFEPVSYYSRNKKGSLEA